MKKLVTLMLASLMCMVSSSAAFASGGGRDDDLMPAPERDAVEAGFYAAESGVPPYEDMMFADIESAQRYAHVATAVLVNERTDKRRYLTIWCKGIEPQCVGVWYDSTHQIRYTKFSDSAYVGDTIEITIDADPPVVLKLDGYRERTQREIVFACRLKKRLKRLTTQIELGYCGR